MPPRAAPPLKDENSGYGRWECYLLLTFHRYFHGRGQSGEAFLPVPAGLRSSAKRLRPGSTPKY